MLKEMKPGPYGKPLRAMVVGKRRNEVNCTMLAAIADKTGYMRVQVYDEHVYAQLEGPVLIKNFTVGRTGLLIANKDTQISQGKALDIPASILHQATLMIQPPTSRTCTIQDIRQGADGLVSITGEVIQVIPTYHL